MSTEAWAGKEQICGVTRSAWPWFPILMFHRIVDELPETNPYKLCHTTAELDRAIRILRRQGYQIVSTRAAIEAHRRGEDVRRFACLTFDDGYRDVLTHALPVLQKHAAPATVFLVSELVGEWNVWDRQRPGVGRVPLLNRDEVLELAFRGIEFGSHSATHPRLSRLPDEERDAEISGSKQTLEKLLGAEVALFAYPHIDQDLDARRRVTEAGYQAALGGEQPFHTGDLLHRITLRGLDELSVRYRLHGWRYRAQRLPILRPSKRLLNRLVRGASGEMAL